ncbi:proteasome subunit alpha, partial [Streptomyces sp. SID7499]|nr:proteasome subunit alpha [Streptomyces sp. SID7499]
RLLDTEAAGSTPTDAPSDAEDTDSADSTDSTPGSSEETDK